MCIYIYICIQLDIYIYIYIYTHKNQKDPSTVINHKDFRAWPKNTNGKQRCEGILDLCRGFAVLIAPGWAKSEGAR